MPLQLPTDKNFSLNRPQLIDRSIFWRALFSSLLYHREALKHQISSSAAAPAAPLVSLSFFPVAGIYAPDCSDLGMGVRVIIPTSHSLT